MHVFKLAAIFAIYIYALFFNWHLLKIQLIFLGGYYFMALIIEKNNPTTIRKKTALSSWNSPGDPSLFNNIELEASKLDSFIEKHNKKYPNHKVTYTTLVIKALAYAVKSIKGLNSTVAFGGFRQIKNLDVACSVDIEGRNLASLLVKNCNLLDVGQIYHQMRSKILMLKTHKHKEFNYQKKLIQK